MKNYKWKSISVRILKLSEECFKRIGKIQIALIIAICLLLFSGSELSASVALVKNGKAALKVLVDGKLLPLEQPLVVGPLGERGEGSLDTFSEQRHAILELLQYVKQMSGSELKVEAAKEGAAGCYVGLNSSFPWLHQDMKDLGAEGFIIRTDKKNIYLIAPEPLGVRHAVITFLMDQGCRWFFPGKVWEVVPQKKTIEGAYDLRQRPSYDLGRTLWYGFGSNPQSAMEHHEWVYHNRMGGPSPVNIGHTWYGIDPEKDFITHPEWFALVNGVRKPSKVCYSNPEVIQKMIKYALDQAAAGATSISLSPADGLGFCECDQCRSWAKGDKIKDIKGSFFATRPDSVLVCVISEALFNAVNQVAKAVAARYPSVMLGCYGYSAYSHPPSFRLEPNVFIQTTTEYRRTPLSLDDQIDLWGQRASHVGIRGYWSVYQWDWDGPLVYKFIPDLIQTDLQTYYKHNARAFNAEFCNNWGPRGLSYYIGSQLLWNINADVKPLINDFYIKAFGPAARSMEHYYARWYGPSVAVIDQSIENDADAKEFNISLNELADNNIKSSMVSKMKLTEAFKDLDEAAQLVSGKAEYQQRVDHIRMYNYYLLLREKVGEAAADGNNIATVEAIKNETEFGGRLTYTNMIHTMPLLGKAFMRLFKAYEPLLKDIPESQTEGKGWRQIGEPPTHDELDILWAQGKKYLGI